MSSPASTGTLGRTGRLRAAHATASASTSRSTVNFTGLRLLRWGPSGESILSRDADRRAVGPSNRSRSARTRERRLSMLVPRPDRVETFPKTGDISGSVVLTGAGDTVDKRRPCRSAGRMSSLSAVHGAGDEQPCLWFEPHRSPSPRTLSTSRPRRNDNTAHVGPHLWQALGRPVRRRASRLAGLLLDPVRELGDLVVDRASLGEQLTDLLVGVHDGGVVAAAELLADLR